MTLASKSVLLWMDSSVAASISATALSSTAETMSSLSRKWWVMTPRVKVRRCSKVHNNLVVLNLRGEEVIYPGNRFQIYALFPETNISIHEIWGLDKLNVVFATGKSIFDRSSKTNIGELMLKYGGGGHEAAGTCQVEEEDAPRVLQELITQINGDG